MNGCCLSCRRPRSAGSPRAPPRARRQAGPPLASGFPPMRPSTPSPVCSHALPIAVIVTTATSARRLDRDAVIPITLRPIVCRSNPGYRADPATVCRFGCGYRAEARHPVPSGPRCRAESAIACRSVPAAAMNPPSCAVRTPAAAINPLPCALPARLVIVFHSCRSIGAKVVIVCGSRRIEPQTPHGDGRTRPAGGARCT
jgi:hypothetical protein